MPNKRVVIKVKGRTTPAPVARTSKAVTVKPGAIMARATLDTKSKRLKPATSKPKANEQQVIIVCDPDLYFDMALQHTGVR